MTLKLKTTKLRTMIQSSELCFLMESHNALSAKISEEAGFEGLWASGLSISSAMGVRDNNEASWTQVLEVLEFMSDATSLPILIDGDTGYGNFNNVRRLVKKLEQRDIAGVCIEDKLFPKTNSFIGGETQPLADIDEFCGKIKAAKDTQCDDCFCVVARVEAFIAGWGLDEALRRAEAYRKAGADAVLVHSKRTDTTQIESFMQEWGGRLPVVIVPTKYYSTPTDKFRDMGLSLVIWANHNLRASISAMKKITERIFRDQSLMNVEHDIVSVSEVFRLQGADELLAAEKRYLPTSGKKVNAIILAASQGKLGELTKNIPKTLLKVGGKTILSMQIDNYNMVGIKDITVVRGFKKEKVTESNIRTVENDQYENTKDLYSLYLAKDLIREDTIISYGDIMFKTYILNDLLNDKNDVTIIVDADYELVGVNKDYVKTAVPYSKKLYSNTVRLLEVSSSLKEINGEFIGLWRVTRRGAELVKNALDALSHRENFKQLHVADLLNEINRTHPVAVKFIKGSWLDIDTIVDLQRAEGAW